MQHSTAVNMLSNPRLGNLLAFSCYVIDLQTIASTVWTLRRQSIASAPHDSVKRLLEFVLLILTTAR